ncbi:MAG: tryptophan--tRNA ligase [Candidatus Shikimatogenerans bostrichidophilus]|nr:MAG: tryptophan--tRNA ligase [Candidatus Shikimatogenerans bostrichidophilus]
MINNKYMVGIKSTGNPHIGNIYSVIIPTILYIKNNINKKKKFFIFLADLHSIINYNNKLIFKKNIYKIASTWLSFLNIKKYKNIFFYRQSDIKEINELFWILSCFYPINRVKLFHFLKKKKINNLNLGLINYPILMASDILLFNINKVIIGKDQKQHIEITRKIANILNLKFKKKIFSLPKEKIFLKKIIIGIDGKKMSKSKNNIINILDNKYILEKQIMNIKTINKPLKLITYKEIKKTILYKIYKIITLFKKEEFINLKQKIKNKKIGFYNIKKNLYNFILNFYSKERKKYIFYLNNKKIINNFLYKNYKIIKKNVKKKILNIKKIIGLKI